MKSSVLAAAALALCGAIFAAPAAQAQGRITRLPLSEVLDTLRSTILSQGVVSWEGHARNPDDGSEWTYQRAVEISRVRVSARACTLSYHYRVVTDGKVETETDVVFELGRMGPIATATETELIAKRDHAAGHASWTKGLTPEIYDVQTYDGQGVETVFSFRDGAAADDAAMALGRARELCAR